MAGDHLAAPVPLDEHRRLGNARHIYEALDDDSYSMKIQFSPDAEGWADVLTGVYRPIY